MGFSSVVYNDLTPKTEDFLSGRGAGLKHVGGHTLEEFVGAWSATCFAHPD